MDTNDSNSNCIKRDTPRFSSKGGSEEQSYGNVGDAEDLMLPEESVLRNELLKKTADGDATHPTESMAVTMDEPLRDKFRDTEKRKRFSVEQYAYNNGERSCPARGSAASYQRGVSFLYSPRTVRPLSCTGQARYDSGSASCRVLRNDDCHCASFFAQGGASTSIQSQKPFRATVSGPLQHRAPRKVKLHRSLKDDHDDDSDSSPCLSSSSSFDLLQGKVLGGDFYSRLSTTYDPSSFRFPVTRRRTMSGNRATQCARTGREILSKGSSPSSNTGCLTSMISKGFVAKSFSPNICRKYSLPGLNPSVNLDEQQDFSRRTRTAVDSGKRRLPNSEASTTTELTTDPRSMSETPRACLRNRSANKFLRVTPSFSKHKLTFRSGSTDVPKWDSVSEQSTAPGATAKVSEFCSSSNKHSSKGSSRPELALLKVIGQLLWKRFPYVALILALTIHYTTWRNYVNFGVQSGRQTTGSPMMTRIKNLEAHHQNALVSTQESRALLAHNEQFRKRIDVVADGFYLGIGYGLANTILIDTPEGLILFDSLEGTKQMREFLVDWKNMNAQILRNYRDTGQQEAVNSSSGSIPEVSVDLNRPNVPPNYKWDPDAYLWGKPILAVFYSHFHSDHVFGASAIFPKCNGGDFTLGACGSHDDTGPGTILPRIIAHRRVAEEMQKVFSVVAGTTYKRSMRQFGSLLTVQDHYINAGIGRRLHYDSRHAEKVLMPTETWIGDSKRFSIGGEEMEWIFAPGESKDQTIAWFPKRRILFGADNVYKAFPNIYAIRGTESRDPRKWVRSLDMMRRFRAEILVLGHTSVVRGEEKIWDVLTSYRDSIQFIHDQTVRFMNQGLAVNDIVSLIELPPYLRQHEFLQQFYGTVSFTVRAVFDHYMGWFSGKAEDLHPYSSKEKAQRMVSLVGGIPQIIEAAVSALEKHDYQWALELASHASTASGAGTRDGRTARLVRITALQAMAAIQPSAPARNWFLTTALEEQEELGIPLSPREDEEEIDDAGLLYSIVSLGESFDEPTHHGGARRGSNAFYQHGIGDKPRRTAARSTLIDWVSRVRGVIGVNNNRGRQGNQGRSIILGLKISQAQRERALESLTSALDCFKFLPVRVRAEAAFEMHQSIVFHFTDTMEDVCVHFRRGIGFAARECEIEPSLRVETTDAVLRSILAGRLSAALAVTTGKLRLIPHDPLGYLKLRSIFGVVELDT